MLSVWENSGFQKITVSDRENHGPFLLGSFMLPSFSELLQSLLEFIVNRWIMGNASGGESARIAGEKADAFMDAAWEFIEQKSVLPENPPFASDSIVQVDSQDTRKENEGWAILKDEGKFVPSKKVMELRNKLIKFMEDHIYPMENEFYKLAQSSKRWNIHPEEEKLKEMAKKEGLWNLWIPVWILASLI